MLDPITLSSRSKLAAFQKYTYEQQYRIIRAIQQNRYPNYAKLEGHWLALPSMMGNIKQIVAEVGTSFNKMIADEALKAMRESIDKGATIDGEWEPLAKRTIRNKSGTPYYRNADKQYLFTEAFKNDLGVMNFGEKMSQRFKVGFTKESHIGYNKKVINYNELASWLEYGTDKIPARPIFEPAMRVAKKFADDNRSYVNISALAKLQAKYKTFRKLQPL